MYGRQAVNVCVHRKQARGCYGRVPEPFTSKARQTTLGTCKHKIERDDVPSNGAGESCSPVPKWEIFQRRFRCVAQESVDLVFSSARSKIVPFQYFRVPFWLLILSSARSFLLGRLFSDVFRRRRVGVQCGERRA